MLWEQPSPSGKPLPLVLPLLWGQGRPWAQGWHSLTCCSYHASLTCAACPLQCPFSCPWLASCQMLFQALHVAACLLLALHVAACLWLSLRSSHVCFSSVFSHAGQLRNACVCGCCCCPLRLCKRLCLPSCHAAWSHLFHWVVSHSSFSSHQWESHSSGPILPFPMLGLCLFLLLCGTFLSIGRCTAFSWVRTGTSQVFLFPTATTFPFSPASCPYPWICHPLTSSSSSALPELQEHRCCPLRGCVDHVDCAGFL